MTPAERLLFHQNKSKPVMDNLKQWLDEQFVQKKVEPNSGLGTAITYMLNRWKQLTLFLEVEGAPLHNNVCNAARGITNVMPPAELCRVGIRFGLSTA
jgi:hypothetical protein